MSRTVRIAGTRIALLVVGLCIGMMLPYVGVHAQQEEAVPAFVGRQPDEHPILAPCSRFGDAYADLEFADKPVNEWPDLYHKTVDEVIEEYLNPETPECNAENYEKLFEAGPKLTELAKKMPIWTDGKVPLSRFDTSRVLMEYLRIYECALMEYSEFLYFDTTVELGKQNPALGMFDIFTTDLMEEGQKRAGVITKERAIARRSLQRVLKLITAFDRLRPIETELGCMQNLSIDIRNISALTAETSACLPRTWNAKDVLRDYSEANQ